MHIACIPKVEIPRRSVPKTGVRFQTKGFHVGSGSIVLAALDNGNVPHRKEDPRVRVMKTSRGELRLESSADGSGAP